MSDLRPQRLAAQRGALGERGEDDEPHREEGEEQGQHPDDVPPPGLPEPSTELAPPLADVRLIVLEDLDHSGGGILSDRVDAVVDAVVGAHFTSS